MSYYIYDTETSKILSNPTRGKSHLRAEYKTMSAAKAALTRMDKKHFEKKTKLQKSKYQFERDKAQKMVSPIFTCGIAESEHYHNYIEKFEFVKSMMNQNGEPIRQSVNTPAYMDPSREAYWTM